MFEMSVNLEKMIGNNVPTIGAVRDTLTVPVSLKLLRLNELCDLYMDLIESVERRQVDQKFRSDFLAYMYTCYAIRLYIVCDSNRLRTSFPQWKRISVPAVWATILDLVGEAVDVDTNIVIVPKADIQIDELMSMEQLAKFNIYLRSFSRSLVLVDFPSERKGNLDFMSKVVVNNEILSYRRENHPAYALLTSIIQKETNEAVFLNMCRVTYGTLENAWYFASSTVTNHD